MWSWTWCEKGCRKICWSSRTTRSWFLGWRTVRWTLGQTRWHVSRITMFIYDMQISTLNSWLTYHLKFAVIIMCFFVLRNLRLCLHLTWEFPLAVTGSKEYAISSALHPMVEWLGQTKWRFVNNHVVVLYIRIFFIVLLFLLW